GRLHRGAVGLARLRPPAPSLGARDDRGPARPWGAAREADGLLLARRRRQLPLSAAGRDVHAGVHSRHRAGDDRQLRNRRSDDAGRAATERRAGRGDVLLPAPRLRRREPACATEPPRALLLLLPLPVHDVADLARRLPARGVSGTASLVADGLRPATG